MATTFVEYTGDGNATKQFSFPSYKESDIKVRVDEVLKSSSTHYNITSYTTTGGGNVVFTSGNIPSSPAKIRIYRDTEVDTAKATFTAGSSVKAADLNNNNTQLLYRAQEEQLPQLIHSYDIDDDAVITAKIKDLNVTTAKLAADAIDGTKIGDDVINSEHYVDLSIDTQHIANENITTAKLAPDAVVSSKLADNAVDSEHYVDGSIDHVHLANDIIDGDNIQDDVINSEHYVAGSIDHEHLANDIIDGDNIQDNAINSEHYVDGSIDHVHLANDVIDGDNIQDDVVNSEHIAAGALDNEHYAAGSITSDKLNGATVITSSEQAAATTNDTSFLTSAAADARFFNISNSDTIKDGQTFPDNDTTIATTAAINDRIIDLVDDVGGFVPIANETSFPTANPDVNNGSGTLVSIKAIGSTRTPSTGTVSIANGSGSNTVTITGCGSTVLTAGFGVIVETTSTLHTYAFHRLVPKATEVTTVAGISSNVTTVAGIASDVTAVAADASDIGVVAADGTDIGLVAGSISNVNTTAGSIANVNTVAGSISNVNSVASNISNVNAVNSNESNINSAVSNASNINSAVSNASNINTVAGSITNVNNVGGSIANVNTVASNLSSVNNFADQYRIGSTNPTTSLDTGDLFFNTTSSSLKVYTGSAWVDGVTTTGDFALKTGNTFTGSNIHNDNVKSLYGTGSDLEIYHDGSNSYIKDAGTGNLNIDAGTIVNIRNVNNASERMAKFTANDSVELYFDGSKKLETTSTGVSVTGNITVSGNVDGRDVAADGNKLDGIATGAIANVVEDTSPQLGGTLDTNNQNIHFNDNVSARFGNSQDFDIYHSGSLAFLQNNTGKLVARSDTFQFGSSDGSHRYIDIPTNEQGVSLYYDDTLKFGTDTAGVYARGDLMLNYADNYKIKLGAGNDLQIYHDGSHSYIKDAGTGRLILQSSQLCLQSTTGENFLVGNPDAATELYHDNSKKLETTSTGVTVTGTLLSDGLKVNDNEYLTLGTDSDFLIGHAGTDSFLRNDTGELYIRSDGIRIVNQANDETYIKCIDDGAVELYHNNNKKVETTSSGVTVTGTLTATNEIISQDDIRIQSAYPRLYLTDTDSNDDYSIINNNGQFLIHNDTQGTWQLKIEGTTGYVGMNLRPVSDSTYNIGTDAVRWANVYADTYYGDGSNLTGIAAFPSGTNMLFKQTSAPTGWTKQTTHNNKALRVVSGTASSGGNVAFTTVFANRGITGNAGNTTATGNVSVANASTGGTVNNHTLSTSEMPSHSHTFNDHVVDSNRGMTATHNAYTFNNSFNASRSTDNTGGGGGHSHGFTGGSHNHNATFSGSAHNHSISVSNLDMQAEYVDVIIAQKD